MFFATIEHTSTRLIVLNVYFVVKGEISDNETPKSMKHNERNIAHFVTRCQKSRINTHMKRDTKHLDVFGQIIEFSIISETIIILP